MSSKKTIKKEPVKRTRSIHLHFAVNKLENDIIRERMEASGVVSLGAYLRRAAIQSYFINIDLSDVREMVSLLRRCSNNLNQYVKRAHETGSIYAADIEDLRRQYDSLWDAANGILAGLAKIK